MIQSLLSTEMQLEIEHQGDRFFVQVLAHYLAGSPPELRCYTVKLLESLGDKPAGAEVVWLGFDEFKQLETRIENELPIGPDPLGIEEFVRSTCRGEY